MLIPLYGSKKILLVSKLKTYQNSVLLKGGWNRLQNRLIANGLNYKGEKVKSSTAIKGALEELKVVCEHEGIDLALANFPQKCMPYTRLIEDLERLNIIKAINLEPAFPEVGCHSHF